MRAREEVGRMAKSKARNLQKEAAWRRRVRRHAESGQSVRAWCRRHGVAEAAFYWWRRELARRDSEQTPARRNVGRSPATRRGAEQLPSQRNMETHTAAFVPVCVSDAPARADDLPHSVARDDSSIEIVLTDGQRVRLTGPVNGQALADVLDVLEHRAC